MNVLNIFVHFTPEEYVTMMSSFTSEEKIKDWIDDLLNREIEKQCERIDFERIESGLSRVVKL